MVFRRKAARRPSLTVLAAAVAVLAARNGAEAADGPSVSRRAHAAHLTRMLQAEELKQSLLDAADSNAVASVLRDARRLQPLLGAEHEYWTSAGDRRALALSDRNRQALDRVILTSRQGDADAAYNSVLALAESCAACHDDHPERRIVVGK